MRQHAVDRDEAPTDFGAATLGAVRRAVGTRARRWLIALTLLLGLLTAVALAVGLPPADRTFAAFANPVQSLMSVTVPVVGILLAHDLRRTSPVGRLAPTLAAGTLLAAAVGVFGGLVCGVALAAAPGGAGEDPWRNAVMVAAGGVWVQVLALLVGTGMGLLLRSKVVAFLATFVPLGVWFLLGSVDMLRPAQDWLTPYATVQHLLSDDASPVVWAQWLVGFLVWGAGLNAVGAARVKR